MRSIKCCRTRAKFVLPLSFFLWTTPVSGQAVFTSAVTLDNVDFENCSEFPAKADPMETLGAGVTTREEGLARILHITPPLAPHGAWATAETDQPGRHFRVAFKSPLAIGTVIFAVDPAVFDRIIATPRAAIVSYLRPDAPHPGDVANEDHWTEAPIPEGQVTQFVVPFPPGISTRAIRLSFNEPLPHGVTSRTRVNGIRILNERVHNLTPEATAFASSQRSGLPHVVEMSRVRNLIDDGMREWIGDPQADISPERPEWVILSWDKQNTFVGLCLFNAFAKTMEFDALREGTQGPAVMAEESAWERVGSLAWPIWWRPAYTDALVPFAAPVTTRALRVRFVEPLTTENPDIVHARSVIPHLVRLGGLMAFTDIGDSPAPPRPAVAIELPPIKIPLTMPADGKLTVAIDDAQGRRVRNLVADVDRKAGEIEERWDGTDDHGNLVDAGIYTVKAITHEPLHLAYQLTVNCSGNPPWWKSPSWGAHLGEGSWLSDHCAPQSVTTIGNLVFMGAFTAEAGHTILACDLDGKKVWGTKWMETAGAAYLANDGTNVFSAGEGAWIGDRMMAHQIDPHHFGVRRVTQLVFDNGISGGLSGIAARDGKLYVAFNSPPRSWLTPGVPAGNVDANNSSAGANLLQMMRIKGVPPPHGVWSHEPSTSQAQSLRLAFLAPQPIGTVVTVDAVEVSALRPEVPYPGDLNDDAQWILFPRTASSSFQIHTAPPSFSTRALRFTFRRQDSDGASWQASLVGAMILNRRFADAGSADFFSRSGDLNLGRHWKWEYRRQEPITTENPAILIAKWPGPITFRGLAFHNIFAKRVEVDVFIGGPDSDPAAAPDSAWSAVGGFSPAVLWRPMFSDDYFDPGKPLTTSAIRLRVVEPWVAENGDIQTQTGNAPTFAGLTGVTALNHLGEDPETRDLPPQRISVVNIADGTWERHLPVPSPRFPHFDPRGRLVCVSGTRVVRVDTATGALTTLIGEGLSDPRGIAFDSQGNMYVADAGPNVVKVFAPEGQLLRSIGKPGGRVLGAYDPERMENPHGIAIDPRGNLWVAENDFQPKRTSLWSTDGAYLSEFIGPARYGAGGALDIHDKSRFYYEGMEFAIDWETGGWKVKNILSRTQPAFAASVYHAPDVFSGRYADRPIYLDGRQYMVNDPGVQSQTELLLVGEFRGDRVVPLTVMGNAEHWGPFRTDPAMRPLVKGKPLGQYSFMWTDMNGDGLPHPEEVLMSPAGARLSPTYWPSYVSRNLEVQMGNRLLRPIGFAATGAPIYDPFNDANRLPPFTSENIYATAIDSAGRVIVHGRPLMALTLEGEVAWSYPQQWVGVHDSQISPGPKPGQLIGALGFVGQEEIPSIGHTFMLNGNKGEWYLFTEDGLLAATIWHDYREPGVDMWHFPKAERGMSLDRVSVGAEHFGGGFFRTDDGKFYLVAGQNHNSIVELTGLDTMRRHETSVTVTAQDVADAEKWGIRQSAAKMAKETPKILAAAPPANPVTSDGNLQEWPESLFTPIGARGSFAVAADATTLYLAFRVDSGQPMRNSGTDTNMLFKTGDSVDLQIGVDSAADPTRVSPAPGDQRLLITLFQGQPIGVLYQHRVPGTPVERQTLFTSPIRVEYVDRILRLDPANIGIAGTARGYSVEALVPLELLNLTPLPNRNFKADFGILGADSGGLTTVTRTYWANQATGLVSDVPSEIMLTPALWGILQFNSN